jgi:hypothetical protein
MIITKLLLYIISHVFGQYCMALDQIVWSRFINFLPRRHSLNTVRQTYITDIIGVMGADNPVILWKTMGYLGRN